MNKTEEEEASFDDWEEGELPSDPMFNEEFKKQQLDLRRKKDELEKISRLLRRNLSCLKLKMKKSNVYTI